MKRAFLLFVVFIASAGIARAETVHQQLDVKILTETADRRIVMVGSKFHLRIHAHVTQQITHFEQLMLPDLVAFEKTSDERHFTPVAGGTDFDEVLTLAPKHAGEIEIGPVTIDAINAVTVLASKFSSTDSVVIHVLPSPQPKFIAAAWKMAHYAAIVAIVLAVAVLTFQIGGMFLTWCSELSRSKRVAAGGTAVRPTKAAALASKTAVQRLRHAVTLIARDPSHQYAEELRSALRDAMGATEEETLADIIARIPESDRGILGRALRAAERAAFIDTASRRSAIEDGLPIFELACKQLEK